MLLPNDAKRIINLLNQPPYKAYAVGGCVRDAIMGRKVSDYDITTSALPEQVEAILDENSIKYVETGIKHGTITAVINHKPYEITTFRTDGKYSDNRHPENVCFVTDISEDLSRRDFTVNAIAFNESEGYVDLFGGMQDIENRIIRAVGDADTRFKEDALRIMRALRFSSQLGFSVEENTKQAIFRNKELLKNIASERIYTELIKLLNGENCSEVISEYIEIIKVFIPEIISIDSASISLAPNKDYIRLALLLKDVGDVPKVLKRLKVSNDVFNKVNNLIAYSGFETSNSISIKKLLNALGEDLFFDLIEYKKALCISQNIDITELENSAIKARNIIDNKEPFKISDLAINGFDLMNLGYKGKEISEALENLLDEVITNPEKNKKEILLSIAQRSISRTPQRLKGFDYSSNGVYFITVCTKDMRSILSRIEVGRDAPDAPQLILSEQGIIVDNELLKMNDIYDCIHIEKYVIMPNHIHLMLVISTSDSCGASRASHPTKSIVSTFIGTLKRFVNKEIGENIWQKSFYDHIIRDDEDYFNHLQYIDENPKKWAIGKDEYYC